MVGKSTYKLRFRIIFVPLYLDKCLYSMKFVRIIDGFDHLWAVKAQDKEADELTILFRNWTNGEYLLDFFMEKHGRPQKFLPY